MASLVILYFLVSELVGARKASYWPSLLSAAHTNLKKKKKKGLYSLLTNLRARPVNKSAVFAIYNTQHPK